MNIKCPDCGYERFVSEGVESIDWTCPSCQRPQTDTKPTDGDWSPQDIDQLRADRDKPKDEDHP